jgi:hypothetical protein
MDQFNNPSQSHAHAMEVIQLINQYEDFMDSVTSIADFGCGAGLDIDWWSKAEYIETTEDRNGNLRETVRKRNIKCYAVDRDISQLSPSVNPAITKVEGDFEKNRVLSTEVDMIWCHNSFQFALSPVHTLKLFNQQMVENGMLYIGLPYQTSYQHNRLVHRNYNLAYYNHNFLSLVYMLAVNGFDCRDAYFLKKREDPWLHAVVYKTNVPPMNPATTTWYELIDKGLINESMKNCMHKYGHMRQEEVFYAWLDKNLHYIED